MKTLRTAAAAAVLALALAAPALAQNGPGAAEEVQPKIGCSGGGCWPLYSYRDMDTDVITIQHLLRQRGFADFPPNEGYFGAQTVRAVKSFQRARGLKANGVVNAATWRALVVPRSYGSHGKAVRGIQVQLAQQYGYNLPITGYYGDLTRGAVRDFQRKRGLPVTGNTDAATWRLLVSYR
jgi:peptidoglycan hydrolase-like protein with peptidoglycan-binding domain